MGRYSGRFLRKFRNGVGLNHPRGKQDLIQPSQSLLPHLHVLWESGRAFSSSTPSCSPSPGIPERGGKLLAHPFAIQVAPRGKVRSSSSMALAVPIKLLLPQHRDCGCAGLHSAPQEQEEMAPSWAVLTSPSSSAWQWKWAVLFCWKLLPGAGSAPSLAAWSSPLVMGARAGGLPKTPGGQNMGSQTGLGWKGH